MSNKETAKITEEKNTAEEITLDTIFKKSREKVENIVNKSDIKVDLYPPYLHFLLFADKNDLNQICKNLYSSEFEVRDFGSSESTYYLRLRSENKALISIVAWFADRSSLSHGDLFKDFKKFNFLKKTMRLDKENLYFEFPRRKYKNEKFLKIEAYKNMIKIIRRSIMEYIKVSKYMNQDVIYFLINTFETIPSGTNYIKKEVRIDDTDSNVTVSGEYRIDKVLTSDINADGEYIIDMSIIYNFTPHLNNLIDSLSNNLKTGKIQKYFKEYVKENILNAVDENEKIQKYFKKYIKKNIPRGANRNIRYIFELYSKIKKYYTRYKMNFYISNILEPYNSELQKYFQIERKGNNVIMHVKFPLYAVGHKEKNKESMQKIKNLFSGVEIMFLLKQNTDTLLNKITKEIFVKYHEVNELDNLEEFMERKKKYKNNSLQLF